MFRSVNTESNTDVSPTPNLSDSWSIRHLIAPSRWLWAGAIVVLCIVLAVLGAWIFRNQLVEAVVDDYFESQGVNSSFEITRLDRAGLNARLSLGDSNAPAVAANDVHITFSQDQWLPEILEIRLDKPVFRARADANGISFPSVQKWVDSLRKSLRSRTHSRFVSDALAVSVDDARIFLTTPLGAIEFGAKLRIKSGQVTLVQARARPALLNRNGRSIRIDGASLLARLVPSGYFVDAHLSALLDIGEPKTSLHIDGLGVRYAASGVRWNSAGDGIVLYAPTSHLQVFARDLRAASISATEPRVDLTLTHLRAGMAGGKISGSGDIHSQSEINLAPDDVRRLLKQLPIFGSDQSFVEAIVDNARTLTFGLIAHADADENSIKLHISSPALLAGARGSLLRINALDVEGSPQQGSAALNAQLSGAHLPELAVQLKNFAWTNSRGNWAFDGGAAIQAGLDVGMLHAAAISATGTTSLHDGKLAFVLGRCAQLRLGVIQLRHRIAANRISGAICPTGKTPLILVTAAGWNLAARVGGLALDAPTAAVRLQNVAGPIQFAGRGGALPTGRFQINSMLVADETPSSRFRPMAATGDVTLARNLWHGQIAIIGGKSHQRIAQLKFSHSLASGSGSATIDAPTLAFAPDKLQPGDLSPLLAAVKRANGSAPFSGVIAWTSGGMTSRGLLTLDQFSFANAFGAVHTLHSEVAFKSLMPPITEAGQRLDIARIDWTLPITNTIAKFSATSDAVHLDAAKADIAGGSASLDALVMAFKSATGFNGTARLSEIELAQVVSALNVGDKIKINGKISGVIPFVSEPQGFRIVNGHLESLGPGRLSIDRTIWTKGSATLNGVQDFAYQALENLAYESLTARINSVSNGRLQIVFHIKGKNDPPEPREARIGVVDLLRGRALEKPVALPSGTPIDLTLDTSLNFDELLRSYRDAWSNSTVHGSQSR